MNKNTKLSRKLKISAVAIFLLFFALGIVITSTNIVYTSSPLINVSERIIAQLAAFPINRIYDPYSNKTIKTYNGHKVPFDNKGMKTRSQLEDYLAKFKKEIKLLEFNNKYILKSAFNFDYQPYEEEKLEVLKKEYGLDEVVEPAKSEFEKFVLLMSWLKNQWLYGRPKKVSYNFNALDILKRAKKGERFFCSEYATTYVQCALSLGFQARYVGLFNAHVVAEIWSNKYEKWVAMDVTNNCYFTRKHIPLNVLELHRLYNIGDWKEIDVIRGPYQDREYSSRFNFSKEELLSYYSDGFYVRMRNDWFTNKYPHWHPKANSIMNGLEWLDEYTRNNIRYPYETKDETQIYFPLNITSLTIKNVRIKRENEITLQAYLNTFTPNFSNFLVTIDNREPYLTNQYDLTWRLHKGINSLSVVSVDKFGNKGVRSNIVLECL